MSQGKIISALWLPALPHVLYPEKSAKWGTLHEAYRRAGEAVESLSPDALVLYSAPWLSVLGTSFQTQPNPRGVHVDDNWYEFGDLPFDFRCDTEMGSQFAAAVAGKGFPTKTVNFDNFPIDTATIVALRFLNPQSRTPVSIVSSWAYADGKASREIGDAMAQVVRQSGKQVVVVACSALTTRYFTEAIDPAMDRISSAEDEAGVKSLLGEIESKRLADLTPVADHFKTNYPVDMQFNAFYWLQGMMGPSDARGRVLSYGPQWGTSAAVIEWRS